MPDWANCGKCGCKDGVNPYPQWTLEGVFESTSECPRRMVTDDIWPWLRLYSFYESGHLYRRGGIEDQPAIYLAVMRLIDGALRELRSNNGNR